MLFIRKLLIIIVLFSFSKLHCQQDVLEITFEPLLVIGVSVNPEFPPDIFVDFSKPYLCTTSIGFNYITYNEEKYLGFKSGMNYIGIGNKIDRYNTIEHQVSIPLELYVDYNYLFGSIGPTLHVIKPKYRTKFNLRQNQELRQVPRKLYQHLFRGRELDDFQIGARCEFGIQIPSKPNGLCFKVGIVGRAYDIWRLKAFDNWDRQNISFGVNFSLSYTLDGKYRGKTIDDK